MSDKKEIKSRAFLKDEFKRILRYCMGIIGEADTLSEESFAFAGGLYEKYHGNTKEILPEDIVTMQSMGFLQGLVFQEVDYHRMSLKVLWAVAFNSDIDLDMSEAEKEFFDKYIDITKDGRPDAIFAEKDGRYAIGDEELAKAIGGRIIRDVSQWNLRDAYNAMIAQWNNASKDREAKKKENEKLRKEADNGGEETGDKKQ